MTVAKADLIDSIYNQVGLSKTRSKPPVESLLEIIKKTVENGEEKIQGIGDIGENHLLHHRILSINDTNMQ